MPTITITINDKVYYTENVTGGPQDEAPEKFSAALYDIAVDHNLFATGLAGSFFILDYESYINVNHLTLTMPKEYILNKTGKELMIEFSYNAEEKEKQPNRYNLRNRVK